MVKNAKILITGGCGFLGSYIAQALAGESTNTLVLFDKAVGDGTTGAQLGLTKLPNVTVIAGSILSEHDMSALPNDFDYIIHAAGFLGIHNVAENQLDNMDINILGSRHCLEVARRQQRLQMYVQFSTSEIYGVDSKDSKEDDDSVIKTVGARWTYATSKLAGEYYVKAYAQRYKVPGVIVRPFNVYGAHRLGGNAMTALITNALQNEPLRLSGDGQQVRAWCNVYDFRDALVALLTTDVAPGEAFNIGDDRFVLTMQELAERIISVTNSSSKIEIQHNDTEDVLQRKPHIAKARARLGYEPKVSLETGIQQVADWVAGASI